MDFSNYKYRASIEKALKEFLPEKISSEWTEKLVGKVRWKQDTEALTKAISQPVWNFLDRGGKRWRPMLFLICCEAVGGEPKKNISYSIIPELIHNGTLIEDDIEDNSELRRGKPVLHRMFGTDIALNAGETLYLLPFTIMRDSKLTAEAKNKAYEIVSGQLLKCFFGQAIDISWHNHLTAIPTEEEYLQMTANKSGSLACMAAKLGALLGGGNPKQIETLGKFGETAGVVFQIQDDILNIDPKNRLGKDYGDDIKEGKRSLLVIHTLQVASEKEKKRLLELLNKHTNDKKMLKEAVELISKYKAMDYARGVAKKIAEESWKETEKVLPENEAKRELKELAKLLINRVM